MQHFAYMCPGLDGGGHVCDVYPQFFDDFYGAESRVVIPVFQRVYVWAGRLIDDWFRDAAGYGASAYGADPNVGHRVGKAMFRRVGPELLCIDGQQRCTTALLLMAAVAARLRHHGAPARGTAAEQQELGPEAETLDYLDGLMFSDLDAMRAWVREASESVRTRGANAADLFPPGLQLPFVRLLPSFRDRAPFFYALLRDRVVRAAGGVPLEAAAPLRAALQVAALDRFEELASRLDGRALRDLASRCAAHMSLMRVDFVAPDLHLPQLFLWMQEKSLFSMGALLFNPTPGVRFRGCDMVRNWVMAHFLDEPGGSAGLESLYRRVWLDRIESPLVDSDRLDAALLAYVRHQVAASTAVSHTARHIGQFETMAAQGFQMMRIANPAADEYRGVHVYGEFQSYMEQREVRDRTGVLAVLEELAVFVRSMA